MDTNLVHIDNFISDYASFRNYCDGLDYEGIENPIDGIFYPGVTLNIPAPIKEEVKHKIEETVGRAITVNFMFMRLSTKGTKAPHQAHTDSTMGEKSLMLYLNREKDCAGGTSFVEHWTGMDTDPATEKELNIWLSDHSKPDKWAIRKMFKMKENAGCIFNAPMMHRAEPIGGFGDSPEDGRLVLTAFFNDC